MREKEKVDYVQIALLSVGLSVLWPYFRLSFMTFVQGYAACSNDDVQYLFTSFVVALLMMVVLASALHRKASQILAKPVTSLALAAIGTIGLVLLWLPLEGVAGLVVFCVGSCLCAVFFAGSVLAYGCVLFRSQLAPGLSLLLSWLCALLLLELGVPAACVGEGGVFGRPSPGFRGVPFPRAEKKRNGGRRRVVA